MSVVTADAADPKTGREPWKITTASGALGRSRIQKAIASPRVTRPIISRAWALFGFKTSDRLKLAVGNGQQFAPSYATEESVGK